MATLQRATAWTAAAILIVGLGASAQAATLTGTGVWSNPAIWSGGVPFNANDGNWSNNVFLSGNNTVTLDGKYDLSDRTAYLGVFGGSPTLNVPATTRVRFGSAPMADGGSGSQSNVTVNITGGTLLVDTSMFGARGNTSENPSWADVNVTAGLLKANDLTFNPGNHPGNVFSLDVVGRGTLSLGSVTAPTGGTVNWTVGGRGRVVIGGNHTADPTLGGLLAAQSGTLQSRLTASGRTIITDANPGPARSRFVYDFESLTPGGLAGQDSWVIFGGSDSTVITGSGVNPTKTATAGATSLMARPNDANFTFLAFSGAETDARMQFDMRLDNVGVTMALGSETALGPFFGITSIGPSGSQFYIREAGMGTEHGASLAGAVSPGEWVRFQLRANLTANSGNGAGSLYYQNLSRGETAFTPVAGLQNVGLNLSVAPAATWSGVGFRIDNAGMPAGNIQIDNMVPNGRALDLRTYSRAVLEDYPVAYWRLGEGPGNAGPLDQVTNTVRGSYGGGETFAKTPGALFNEPTAGAIGYTGAGTFSTGTSLGQTLFGGESQLTVEFWVRPNASQSGIHYLEYGPSTSDFSLEGTTLNPNWYVNNAFMGTLGLTQGAFQLVDLVFDGVAGEARIYLNGQQVSLRDTGVPAAINDLASAFFLGSRGGNQRIPNADYQELAIYHSVLSSEQIYAHYFASIVPEPSTGLMLVMGAVGLVAKTARRRKRRTAP